MRLARPARGVGAWGGGHLEREKGLWGVGGLKETAYLVDLQNQAQHPVSFSFEMPLSLSALLQVPSQQPAGRKPSASPWGLLPTVLCPLVHLAH